MKKFNVTGTCIPEKHYMVDISKKVQQIVTMIENGEYFTINRARQYGKTTTVAAVYRELKNRYIVLRLSFEGLGEIAFQNNVSFVKMFVRKVAEFLTFLGESEKIVETWKDMSEFHDGTYEDAMDFLGMKITCLCQMAGKEIVLLIDEVDKSSDNQVFLDFLGLLRNKYLKKVEGMDATFHSVVLAGVYDIKNLKIKLRPDEERKYNSPWNIATEFKVDMSFSAEEIASMLAEYEKEQQVRMDIRKVSQEIYFYTSGYPFLVSKLCKLIDEEQDKEWSTEGIRKAEKELLKERNTLFDDLIKNVEKYEELKNLIVKILCNGQEIGYNVFDFANDIGTVLGIIKNENGKVAISNIIFETCLYDYMTSIKSREDGVVSPERNQFIENGRLNMEQVLVKFQELMRAEYRLEDEKFIEKQGRLLFLCFLKPIINGTGFYFVEPETRNNTRMDIVVVYGGEEFIVELKIWRGDAYRENGIKQLERYMDSRGCNQGYLVSFSFQQNKKYEQGYLNLDKNDIYEIVV